MIRVHHLNCGPMHPPLGKIFPGLFPSQMACHCLLVETPNSLVLIDAGYSKDCLAKLRPIGGAAALSGIDFDPASAAIEQIKRKGFSPTDVRHIVLTHLDIDHSDGVRDFPWAQVHAGRVEVESALFPGRWIDRIRYRHMRGADLSGWILYGLSEGEAWMGFQAQALTAISSEILAIPLAGHTRGHLGVAVSAEAGWILAAGDAYYDHREFDGRSQPGLRILQNALTADPAAARANLRRLGELRGRAGAPLIFCSHDHEEFKRSGG